MIHYLGYTLPFSQDYISNIKNYYYGKWKKNENVYDKFFETYSTLDENKKTIAVFFIFRDMITKYTINLSQNEKDNVIADVFLAIAKNINKIDIKYRGLAKYMKLVISSRVINERKQTARFNGIIDENIMIDNVNEEIENDRDYDLETPKQFIPFIKQNGEIGQLIVDVYQNEILTAKGIYNRCLLVEPNVNKEKLKEACKKFIQYYIKKGGN